MELFRSTVLRIAGTKNLFRLFAVSLVASFPFRLHTEYYSRSKNSFAFNMNMTLFVLVCVRVWVVCCCVFRYVVGLRRHVARPRLVWYSGLILRGARVRVRG